MFIIKSIKKKEKSYASRLNQIAEIMSKLFRTISWHLQNKKNTND
jgi:hypothetical protein